MHEEMRGLVGFLWYLLIDDTVLVVCCFVCLQKKC